MRKREWYEEFLRLRHEHRFIRFVYFPTSDEGWIECESCGQRLPWYEAHWEKRGSVVNSYMKTADWVEDLKSVIGIEN